MYIYIYTYYTHIHMYVCLSPKQSPVSLVTQSLPTSPYRWRYRNPVRRASLREGYQTLYYSIICYNILYYIIY